MAWTAPRTWVTGEVVTAAMMNTHVRDNLLAIHDFGAGAIITVAAFTGRAINAVVADAEVTKNMIPMSDFNSQSLTVSLRFMGQRWTTTQGGGSDQVTIRAGSVTANFTSEPTFTLVSTIASSADATPIYKDTGWVALPGGITLTNLILACRIGMDSNNSGQVSFLSGNLLARIQ